VSYRGGGGEGRERGRAYRWPEATQPAALPPPSRSTQRKRARGQTRGEEEIWYPPGMPKRSPQGIPQHPPARQGKKLSCKDSTPHVLFGSNFFQKAASGPKNKKCLTFLPNRKKKIFYKKVFYTLRYHLLFRGLAAHTVSELT